MSNLSFKFQKVINSFADLTLADIVRGVAFLGTLGVSLYLFVVGRDLPTALVTILGGFFGYYVRGTENTLSTSAPQAEQTVKDV